jgi:RNA polymerase sigma factor (TIGR02999 family)
MPAVYKELKRLARSYLRNERPNHTLQATALVNEAYLRLIDQRNVTWQNRAHFFGVAAQAMRRILVDHARKKQAAKRGRGERNVSFDEAKATPKKNQVDLVALDDCLADLEQIDERQCRIVELKYFVGLSVEETAEILDLSTSTVKREWAVAKAWLRRELRKAESHGR